MNVVRGNYEEHIRRNPHDVKGKLRAGGGDLMGDEEMQAENWRELVEEGEGQYESRIDDVGNAQDAILAGTGDLDHVVRFAEDQPQHDRLAAGDSPDLVNPIARDAAKAADAEVRDQRGDSDT